MYRERPSRIAGAFIWSSVSAGDEKRILPDGCMDFLWDGHEIVIAGPDTRAHLFASDAGSTMTGLRFAPGFAPRVLGVPADEFTDQRVPLEAVWTAADIRRATDFVAASANPARALETLAWQSCAPPGDDAALVERVVTLARDGHNSTEIAARVGLSTRQLQRRSSAAFGYGAKTLHRVLRMQHALALVRRGIRPADSAARSGYADQSHLSRDVKEMAGVPLGQLVS